MREREIERARERNTCVGTVHDTFSLRFDGPCSGDLKFEIEIKMMQVGWVPDYIVGGYFSWRPVQNRKWTFVESKCVMKNPERKTRVGILSACPFKEWTSSDHPYVG